jgi:CHASE2 domain-containing sensor protein
MADNLEASSDKEPKSGPVLTAIVEFVVISAFLIAVQVFLENVRNPFSDFLAEVKTLSFAWLQRALPNFDPNARLDVVVVDISDIKGGRGVVSDRDALMALLGAIASVQPAPRAVAVDIDFSPGTKTWIAASDPAFLDFCEALPVPIILGVDRARDDGPDAWLNSSRYSNMAAATRIWQDENSPTKVTTHTYANYFPPEGARSSVPLVTMSYALAKAFVEGSPTKGVPAQHWPNPSPWVAWLTEPIPPDEDALSKDGSMLINYSKLRQLHHERLLTKSAISANEFAADFQNKMVILGDVRMGEDAFLPPEGGVTRGVFGHAIGAYTMAKDPVFELRPAARILFDLLAALPLFFLILKTAKAEKAEQGKEQLHHVRAAWLSALGVMVGGVLLVILLRIMWIDFFLTALALVVHPVIHRWIERPLHRPTAWLARMYDKATQTKVTKGAASD